MWIHTAHPQSGWETIPADLAAFLVNQIDDDQWVHATR